MAPPTFTDLGKTARQIVGSEKFPLGVVKLDIKSQTKDGLMFNLQGVHTESQRVTSSLETKYNIKSHGITLKQKWNTDNVAAAECLVEDYFVRGMKAGVSATFAPQSGKRTGKLSCGYKTLFLNLNSDIDFDHAGPVFNGSGVFGYLGWLAGMKLTFDPTKNKLSKSNFALGYQAPEFHVTGHLDDGQEFNCLIYQKLRDDLEAGINVAWSSTTNVTKFGLGYHYKLDCDSAIRGKVNSASQVGVAFIHRLRPGINMTLSAMIDAKNFNQGGHKLGLGFDVEA